MHGKGRNPGGLSCIFNEGPAMLRRCCDWTYNLEVTSIISHTTWAGDHRRSLVMGLSSSSKYIATLGELQLACQSATSDQLA